ncbi:hypothetical protein HY439_01470 [Candidatus Microgenomates bacterium]|nr:hypothetical protein [Candidatus Microgenomates bacterium]
MKKESIIVGIFGLSLGLLVAWGIWNFKSGPTETEEIPTPEVATDISPTLTPPTSLLTLDLPIDGQLATSSSMLVSGKTKAGATVVISSPAEDKALVVPTNGVFSQDLKLEEGENTVTVTVYPQEGQKEETIERTVIYSTD